MTIRSGAPASSAPRPRVGRGPRWEGPGGRVRLWVGCLLVLSFAGCEGWWGGGEDTSPDSLAVPAAAETGDSLASDSLNSDSLAPDSAGQDSVGDSAPTPLDTAGAAAPAGAAVTDSLAGGAAGASADTSVAARVARLEAENDSLRSALTGLAVAVGLQTPAAEEEERPPFDAGQLWAWILRGLVATAFLIVVAAAIRGILWVLERLAEANAKRRLFFKRLIPIVRIVIWAGALPFTAMVILGVSAQGLVAAGAAIGVAVGFAAQDILKNIFGGIIVLFDQPFQVGDKVSIQGTYGEVVSMGLRSTRLVTPDDNLVTVPNSQVVGDQVANANAGELNCQVVTDLYLPGWVDEARAKEIAFEAAASSKYVFLNKPIAVLVKDEFKETFLTHLKVKAYVLDPRYEFLFMSDVTERARAEFRRAGLLGPMHGVRAYVDLDRWSPEERGASRAPDAATPDASAAPTTTAGSDGADGGERR